MTFEDLHKIVFPIYVLHTDEVEEQDGLLFCDTQIVDDKNVKGNTIGQRRLKSPHKSLYPLKFMLTDFRSMIMHRGENYVDTEGKYFRYQKTRTGIIKSYEIENIEQKELATMIKLKNVRHRFETKTPPDTKFKFAQVLMIDNRPSVLWSVSIQKEKNTWRKI
tara:strand:- start:14 stop:502 length:489 start_codon:yes stop_codon:yes gene_type:complete